MRHSLATNQHDLTIPDFDLKRIVIVGAGFGGIELVKRIDKRRFQVVMLDKNNYHTFKPLLYQVATAGLEPEDISFPLKELLSTQENLIFRNAEVLEVKKEGSILITSTGEIKYDYLIIATGSTSNYYGNKNIQLNVMSLNDIDDAINLKSLLSNNFEKLRIVKDPLERKQFLNIVIVGGGTSGVEIAGVLSEIKNCIVSNSLVDEEFKNLQIHLIEASGRLLATMSNQSSAKSKHFLENMGVKLWLNTSVVKYIDNKVVLDDNKIIDCNTCIWTAGIKGQLIKGFSKNNITKGNRIKTDVYNRITGCENIFAVGDIAAIMDTELIAPHPMVASVAIQQAKNLANNLNLQDTKQWRKFNYKQMGIMATIGRNRAVVDFKYFRFQGIFAWYIGMLAHLLPIAIFPNRLIVFFEWIWNYFIYKKTVQSITYPYKNKKMFPVLLRVPLFPIFMVLHFLKKIGS
jgi:NADH dehydrogenase